MIFSDNKYREMAIMALCLLIAIFFWYLLFFNEIKTHKAVFTFEVLLPNKTLYKDSVFFSITQRNNFVKKEKLNANISISLYDYIEAKRSWNNYLKQKLTKEKISFLSIENIKYNNKKKINLYSKTVKILPEKKFLYSQDAYRFLCQFYPNTIEIYGDDKNLKNIEEIRVFPDVTNRQTDSIIPIQFDWSNKNYFAMNEDVYCIVKKIPQKEHRWQLSLPSSNFIEKTITLIASCDERLSNFSSNDFKISFTNITNANDAKLVQLSYDTLKWHKVKFYPTIIHSFISKT